LGCADSAHTLLGIFAGESASGPTLEIQEEWGSICWRKWDKMAGKVPQEALFILVKISKNSQKWQSMKKNACFLQV
jgi:hypothetical protein